MEVKRPPLTKSTVYFFAMNCKSNTPKLIWVPIHLCSPYSKIWTAKGINQNLIFITDLFSDKINIFCWLSSLISIFTTQVNSTFSARWLASSEVINQLLFTSEQLKKNKMAFVGTFSQIKLLFWRLVIQLVWYILKQLFASVSVNNC